MKLFGEFGERLSARSTQLGQMVSAGLADGRLSSADRCIDGARSDGAEASHRMRVMTDDRAEADGRSSRRARMLSGHQDCMPSKRTVVSHRKDDEKIKNWMDLRDEGRVESVADAAPVVEPASRYQIQGYLF